MALDATQQARVAAINAKLLGKDWISGPDRDALRTELSDLLGGNASTSGGVDRETQREINRLMQMPAYLDGRHIDHQQLVDDVGALYARAAGDQSGGNGGSSDGTEGA